MKISVIKMGVKVEVKMRVKVDNTFECANVLM